MASVDRRQASPVKYDGSLSLKADLEAVCDLNNTTEGTRTPKKKKKKKKKKRKFSASVLAGCDLTTSNYSAYEDSKQI